MSDQKFKLRVPLGVFGPGGQWAPNPLLTMSSDEQRRQNVEQGFLPAVTSTTTRAALPITPGTITRVRLIPDETAPRLPWKSDAYKVRYRWGLIGPNGGRK